jgi:anti-sigma B factor antagonist
MEFSLQNQDNILFAILKGDLLGESSGSELVEILQNKIKNEGLRLCGIDLSELRYMNSSGISILLNVLNMFKQSEGEAVIVKPSPQIKKLLEMMKLNSIFSIVDSKEEAINQLHKIII